MDSRVKKKEERLYMPEDAIILTEAAVITGNYVESIIFLVSGLPVAKWKNCRMT